MHSNDQFIAPCTATRTVRGTTYTEGETYSCLASALVYLDPHGPLGEWTSRPLADVLPTIVAHERVNPGNTHM